LTDSGVRRAATIAGVCYEIPPQPGGVAGVGGIRSTTDQVVVRLVGPLNQTNRASQYFGSV